MNRIKWNQLGRKIFILFYTIHWGLLIHVSHCSGQVVSNRQISFTPDTVPLWSATSEKVINLTPYSNGKSLKKWYLNRLKSGYVTAYKEIPGESALLPYQLSMPELKVQDWLKGLLVELSPHRFPQEWYFVDPSLPADDYNRYKARVRNLNPNADSCCGCDEADAFRVRQQITYGNGRFSIHNSFISPLCARATSKPPADWYPLCNLALNDNPERTFPGAGNNIQLLNTNELDYHFNRFGNNASDSVHPSRPSDIGNLLYQDILLGRLRPIDPQTGKPIPVKELLTRGLPADTIAVYDPDDPAKLKEYKVVQQQRNPEEFNHIRIKQELYFDFDKERLYAVIRSLTVLQAVYTSDGKILIGRTPFMRLESYENFSR